MNNTDQILKASAPGDYRKTIFGLPSGFDILYLKSLAAERGTLLHICADDQELDQMRENAKFFAPELEVIVFPAWDCLPYDRVSPTADVAGERIAALAKILEPVEPSKDRLILTSLAAATQKIPPRKMFQDSSFSVRKGGALNLGHLMNFLAANGYSRSDTVREPGEYAVRGGLIDIFPSGASEPMRLDLFGDTVESMRSFDALTQRTTHEKEALFLVPTSEVLLTQQSVERFRKSYRAMFGAVRDDDPLYESISAGQRHAGCEHWLPLFHEKMETLFDYAGCAVVTLSHQVESARENRLAQVHDFYEARAHMTEVEKKSGNVVYNPIPPESLYFDDAQWQEVLSRQEVLDFLPFAAAEGQEDAQGRIGRDFGDVRARKGGDVYADLKDHIKNLMTQNKKVLIAAYSAGARDRLHGLLKENGIACENIASWEALQTLKAKAIALTVLGIDRGFTAPGIAVISEQDILGDRLTRSAKKKRKSDTFIQEISQLREGDYVVHEDHGIGRFLQLETLEVDGIAHDCLKLEYAGGDKLYVPVENLDVLSRYGSSEAGAQTDRLGGAAWQARKAKVKRDLMAIAQDLMKIAAQRILHRTESLTVPHADYDKFCAGFPYPETEDQLKAIEETLHSLTFEQATDRLICGDVGFGKTEVALRAAFVAAMSGHQVAVVTPTTLLCRQHYKNFVERFKGFPIEIVQLSRLVTAKQSQQAKEEISSGKAQIVIGTHALLSEGIKFANLGLLVVDEEQRFGVKQKEKLKALKESVHVLTLTATPIPRTLQMALSGVRELSLITTPPADRLAVRTFVLPQDRVIIREALMREHHRGGQSFYVCPRIADMADLETMLKDLVPELKVVPAHGQMSSEELEKRMTAFYDGGFDVFLTTSIVESGLDIPNANTMIIHRADMFGLAQLYQMRGRIGRSKQRAYAYLTYDVKKPLTKAAEQRLHAISQLDTLGAGFQLASHDLDIRGAGNLLGEEQSGHIREIGVELYQQMLEEAVAAARMGETSLKFEERWSPQINMGVPVLIPQDYIPDLNVRLTVYRKISSLADKAEIDSYAAEMIDRFGPLPDEVENLLKIVEIKSLCRDVGVDRIEAGPKGAVLSFHPSGQLDVQKLVAWIARQAGAARMRPEDQKLVFSRAWEGLDQRVKGVRKILTDLKTALN